jgi:Fe-S oxidoreductase
MIKKCAICNSNIDTDVDSYSKVYSFSGKKELSKIFYHTPCFLERIKSKYENKAILEKAMNMLNKVNNKIVEAGM